MQASDVVAAVRRRARPGPISQHVLATYGSLRKGLVLMAFALPIALLVLGAVMRVPVQQSLSAYYFAFPSGGDCAAFPLRVVFAGTLCAIGLGLYLYKGFTPAENWLLNLAAVFAWGVALVPKGVDDPLLAACAILAPIRAAEGQLPMVHAACALAMFTCLAAVAWFCAVQTLQYLPPGPDREALATRFRRTYRGLAVAMLTIAPLAIALHGLGWTYTVLVAEWAGIWIFATYWATKTRELSLSDAERRAVRNDACAERPNAAPPLPPDFSVPP